MDGQSLFEHNENGLKNHKIWKSDYFLASNYQHLDFGKYLATMDFSSSTVNLELFRCCIIYILDINGSWYLCFKFSA